MTTYPSRRGSALLIVLGMLAFMVVSAVAFAAYMRYSRLPSSYLRRTTASRQLVKAALARAIDEIDKAVCNNPNPGLGTASAGGTNRNYWKNRVYFGAASQCDISTTAPVLTPEGLAYIPPPLVNEARYYGRRSPAAQWKTFDFDAGRYAFCALDVSDYFDVNRLFANYPRNSSSSRRISLAYLFENASHTSSGTGADEWDSWMKNFRDYDESDPAELDYSSKMPLVSLADFNLALGSHGRIGDFKSPFYEYYNPKSSGGVTDFYNANGEAARKALMRMTFVTDSWFPEETAGSSTGTDAAEPDLYLGDPENQPFKRSDLEESMPALLSVLDYSGNQEAITQLFNSICGLGLCALWDYLDFDSVPVSLAVPTTERVPMVCGLDPVLGGGKIKIEKNINDEVSAEVPKTSRLLKRTVTYSLDPTLFGQTFMGASVKTLVAYPFNHDDAISDSDNTFTYDGRFSLFFTSADMKLRTGSVNDALHFKNFENTNSPNLDENGVLTIPFLRNQQISIKSSSIKSEEDALKLETGDLTTAASYAANKVGTAPLLTLNYNEIQQTWDFNNNEWTPQPTIDDLESAACGMPPLKADGTPDNDFKNPGALLNFLKGGGAKDFKLNACVALGIKNKNGDFVDLAPACIKDDDDLNKAHNYATMGPVGNELAGKCYPLLRMDASAAFTVSIASLDDMADNGTEIDVKIAGDSAIVCADPRYNHAPEDWFFLGNSERLTKERWLGANESEDREGDIFMAVSDQGYLQSIYELAFLPCLTDLESYGANKVRGNYKTPDDGRTVIGTGFGSAVNNALMWRTYRPYGSDADDFDGTGFTSAGSGYKINPYTDSTNVMMAAFANTPVDWRLASTNNSDISSADLKSAKSFNAKYAWNGLQSKTVLDYEALEGIAGAFMESISPTKPANNLSAQPQSRAFSRNWKDAWREMDWDKVFDEAESDDSHRIWSADRKFLYGFWRDCFSSRQHLFLVFVRAEPMMMGGGAMGRVPPQLGSRAVALVWRDANETTPAGGGTSTGYPHRTRVLFYRNLE